MEIPHDIEVRLERRWFARHNQDAKIRRRKQVLNETEVTDQKVKDEPALTFSVTRGAADFVI